MSFIPLHLLEYPLTTSSLLHGLNCYILYVIFQDPVKHHDLCELVPELIVLVHLCCCNKIPQIGSLISSKLLFLSVLEPGNSKIKGLEDSVSGENQLPLSLCPHMAERVRELSVHKDTNPIHKGSSL